MTITAYLAGPDVFLPAAREHARRKVEVCARHGVVGRAPLDEDAGSLDAVPVEATWDRIFRQDLAIMEAIVIMANLTPFCSALADAGTQVELSGFFGGPSVLQLLECGVAVRGAQPPAGRGTADPLPGPAIEEQSTGVYWTRRAAYPLTPPIVSPALMYRRKA
jgi:Nucleoside 2-deoxyribosyltransferase